MAAGVTLWNFYFQIFERAIAKEQVVEFPTNLVRQLAGPLLIVWDRLPAHRSRLVAEFVEFLEGQIELEYLPAYAPELNPVEYLWGHWKHHELPNVCRRNSGSSSVQASVERWAACSRRPRLITAFWKQASLFEWILYIMRDSVVGALDRSAHGLGAPRDCFATGTDP